MKTSSLRTTLTTLMWSASFLAQPLTGLAQTTNQVLSLDGSGDYVSIPSAADLQNPVEITVEAWIYPSNSASGYFIIKGDAGFVNSARSYELKWVPGSGNNLEFSVFLGDSTWGDVGAPAPVGQWVHFAGTYSSADSALRIYTNGVLVGETTTDASGTVPLNHQLLRQTTLPLVFGAELTHPLGFIAGRMDEVRIWSKARTQAEIAGSMFCPSSGNESNLMGYWNFDDGTATDLTGHGHNGTFTGNAHATPIVGSDAVHAGECGTIVSIRVSQVELCWVTLTNKWYQLQYESALTTNQWVPFMAWIAGDGSRFCTNDAVLANQAQRFYRVADTNAPPQ